MKFDINAILKNNNKYTDNIKLAKGVLLDNAKTAPRFYTELGISTKTYGHSWFLLPQGRAIFKTFDSDYQEIKTLRIINELLCEELANQLNIKCAHYELATKDKINGVVTYDITKMGQTLYTAFDWFEKNDIQEFENEFKSFALIVNHCKENNINIDKNKFMIDLYKLMVFDILTVQGDRHLNNIFIIQDQNDNSLKLAPLLDNEFAFNTGLNWSNLYGSETITQDMFIDSLSYIYKQIMVLDNRYRSSKYLENIKQVVDLAKMYPQYDIILKSLCKTYNLNNAIEKLEQKGVQINKKYKEYLLMTQDTVKQLIKLEYTKTNRVIRENDYKNIIEK